MKCGLIGEKLSHSYSKRIHELMGRYSYELLPMPENEVAGFLKNGDFDGLNVTIPYKQLVIPYLDGISDRAKAIGAVNTIYKKDGGLYGENTDFTGMRETLLRAGFELGGKTVLVLGGGGTSKTACAVCRDLGAARVLAVSRRPSDGQIAYEQAGSAGADYIINTTPVGMHPDTGKAAVDLSGFPGLSGVFDVIFNPLRTKLLLDAKKLGVPYVSGLYMLVSQAVAASEFFTGKKASDGEVERIYGIVRGGIENIVLTGMPGSGKTTVGKLIAEKTGKEFIDIDEVLTKKIGNIARFIKYKGEPAFREEEAAAIKRVTQTARGTVISTGGGAVLREENIRALAENGTLFFLDRPPDLIIPDGTRPLSSDREKLNLRYKERYPVYTGTADHIIPCDKERFSEYAAEKIVEIYEKDTCFKRT